MIWCTFSIKQNFDYWLLSFQDFKTHKTGLFYFAENVFLNPHPRICLLIFRERKGERERKREKRHVREKHQLVASWTCPNGAQTQNLGICSDRWSSLWPFAVGDNAPTNWSAQPGLLKTFLWYAIWNWFLPFILFSHHPLDKILIFLTKYSLFIFLHT